MRVLVVNHTPTRGSGSGTYAAEVARGLARAGHQPTVLTPGPIPVRRRAEGVLWLEIPVRADGHFPSFTGHPDSSLIYDDLDADEITSYSAVLTDTVRSVAVEERIQLVHAQHLGFVAQAAVGAHLPVVVTSHGSEFRLLSNVEDERWTRIRDTAISLAPVTVWVSKAVRDQARSVLGHDLYLGPVIYSGFDSTVFTPLSASERNDNTSNLIRVVVGGRLVPYKRIELALSALSIAQREFERKIHVDIVGDGPQRDSVAAWAKRSALSYELCGHLAPAALAKRLQNACLFVSPALDEPFGLLALEAIGAGCPALVSARSGIAEILDETAGRFVSSNDPNAWAVAIRQELSMARDPRLVSGSVASFTWVETINQLFAHYRVVEEKTAT